MHPFINIANAAARNAGKAILRGLERLDTIRVTAKGHKDFVTEIDKQAEKIIVDTIRKSYPHHAILAEESGISITEHDITWIIDPLDGTKNFIHGFPHFAVSIAIKNKDRIEHGLIYDPIRQETFTASRGAGAQLNNRRIRVSNRIYLQTALLGTGFPFRETQSVADYLKVFSEFTIASSGIRRAGSAALDLAYVAAGRLDGFWESGLSPWDIAAGVLLVKEAGGLIIDYQGTENYLTNGEIIAGPLKIVKEMLKVIGTK